MEDSACELCLEALAAEGRVARTTLASLARLLATNHEPVDRELLQIIADDAQATSAMARQLLNELEATTATR